MEREHRDDTQERLAVYIMLVEKQEKMHPEWRRGQTYFNVLHRIEPTFANTIRGDPDLDPFYDDDKLPEFLAYVVANFPD